MRKSGIWSIEKTFQGAWAIRGLIGLRQYMGYTKTEAKRKYLAEIEARRVERDGIVFYKMT